MENEECSLRRLACGGVSGWLASWVLAGRQGRLWLGRSQEERCMYFTLEYLEYVSPQFGVILRAYLNPFFFRMPDSSQPLLLVPVEYSTLIESNCLVYLLDWCSSLLLHP